MVLQFTICLGISTSLPKADKALRGSIGAVSFLMLLLETLLVVEDLWSVFLVIQKVRVSVQLPNDWKPKKTQKSVEDDG